MQAFYFGSEGMWAEEVNNYRIAARDKLLVYKLDVSRYNNYV